MKIQVIAAAVALAVSGFAAASSNTQAPVRVASATTGAGGATAPARAAAPATPARGAATKSRLVAYNLSIVPRGLRRTAQPRSRRRISPSWAVEATRVPERSNTDPRAKPRAPEALGLSPA